MAETGTQLRLFDDETPEKLRGNAAYKTKCYDEFVAKFEVKKTTDDCYTPPAVYDAVLAWVKANCGLSETDTILRPFKPGGDYLAEHYDEHTVVVDNPPFSILSEICRNYSRMGVRFFLFAPTLTGIRPCKGWRVTKINADAEITYENGAKINTSFVTNMAGDAAVMTAPSLTRAVEAADKARQKVNLPKFAYPDELVTAGRLNKICRYVEFRVGFDECSFVSQLDTQATKGKQIFGGGYLIAEDRAAELRAAMRFPLSEREQEIVKNLGKHETL